VGGYGRRVDALILNVVMLYGVVVLLWIIVRLGRDFEFQPRLAS
jgi:MFS superfamily sulfate permease-like transporter